jgi:hypothetical protein
MPRKSAADREAEEAAAAEAAADEETTDDEETAADDLPDDLAEAAESGYDGDEPQAYEDTAPPDTEPGNAAIEAMVRATDAENDLIARNERRYELRSGGMSSEEVNQIEREEKAAARGDRILQ